ncbi:uncharacterized protein A1O5_02141 [Cladophialophora psammophila CBS 110553]|uniref:Uncharacterized protein n=1 Tax=Cladophialophora psammophila CBS 110553 TaxID=1182543 RepID=W9XDP8_9EURO|nr:uncharacterized protein A1O5_02141 [Cladophialophora psammophila CBS 110553]EXJ75445.1 hypothetical protein A1O5_02141 [Cladophialophora psammophila CBS 110553]
MSAPRQSSPLSADLEIPCPILQSLSDKSDVKAQGAASDKVSRMDSIQEESPEPEDDPCQPCLHTPLAAGGKIQDDHTIQSGSSEAISEYVLKIREAIKLQGQTQNEQPEEHGRESEKLDFHIKVGGKRTPMSLLKRATERGRTVVANINSRVHRVSSVISERTAGNSAHAEVTPKGQKHTSLLQGLEEKKGVCILKSHQRISVVFSRMRTKSPEQGQEKPKIKSKNGKSACSVGAGESPGTQHVASFEKSYAGDEDDDDDDDDNSDDGSEAVGLLSDRGSASFRSDSFDARHFYTPMVPSGLRRDYEYRLHRSRFRRSITFSRELAVKSVQKVIYYVDNALSARRKMSGWSRLEH